MLSALCKAVKEEMSHLSRTGTTSILEWDHNSGKSCCWFPLHGVAMETISFLLCLCDPKVTKWNRSWRKRLTDSRLRKTKWKSIIDWGGRSVGLRHREKSAYVAQNKVRKRHATVLNMAVVNTTQQEMQDSGTRFWPRQAQGAFFLTMSMSRHSKEGLFEDIHNWD